MAAIRSGGRVGKRARHAAAAPNDPTGGIVLSCFLAPRIRSATIVAFSEQILIGISVLGSCSQAVRPHRNIAFHIGWIGPALIYSLLVDW